ncbi:hypothetical protein ACPBEI_07150 [Latilactobacillus sakei]
MTTTITTKKSKELAVLSGGTCSLCGLPLLNEEKEFNGEFAHIEGQNSGSARFNSDLSVDAINATDNIIVLCASCHTDVDKNTTKYTKNYLLRKKEQHEQDIYNDILSSSLINMVDSQGGTYPNTFINFDKFLVREYKMPFDENYKNEVLHEIKLVFNLTVFERNIFLNIINATFSGDNYKLTLRYFQSAYPKNNVLSPLATCKIIDTMNFDSDLEEDKTLSINTDVWETIMTYCKKNSIKISELVIYRHFDLLD